MKRCATVVAWVLVAACARPTTAQVGPEASVLDLLAGSWVGEGTLMGRSAAFTMTWTRVAADTLRLDFTNGFRGDDGAVTPVLSAVAFYSVGERGIVATWTDDRPQRLTITAAATDSVLTSDWTAAAEQGRTEYRVLSDGTVGVRDWVRSGGELRGFGEAMYRRAGG